LEQDILRLDVAVDHPVAVGVVEGTRNGAGDLDGGVHGELLLPLEALAQRFACDMRHGVVDEAAGLAGVEERQDVGVLQVRGDPDLAQKPLDAEQGRQFGFQDLERDETVVLQVARDVHRRHPADASFALDRVLLGEGGGELREKVGHRGRK
jgi:hypothetical protein